MKTKTIISVSILLVSCAAVAADSPFEKGKTYAFHLQGPISTEIKDVKGKWLLINNNESACERFPPEFVSDSDKKECWINSDLLDIAVQINKPK